MTNIKVYFSALVACQKGCAYTIVRPGTSTQKARNCLLEGGEEEKGGEEEEERRERRRRRGEGRGEGRKATLSLLSLRLFLRRPHYVARRRLLTTYHKHKADKAIQEKL